MPSTVLIVEDDFIIAFDVAGALIDAGYEVAAMVSSEVEALDVASRIKPDFAIVDVELAPGDGRVVAQQLNQRYGTKVLFATAQSRDVERLTASGAMACLPKPYAARDVPRALRSMMTDVLGGEANRPPAQMIALSPSL
jgi:DNA-binding response OmpR family regulator